MALSERLILGGLGLLAAGVAIAAPSASEYERTVQPIFTDNCIACHQLGQAPDNLVLEERKSFGHLVGKRSAHAALLLVAPGQPDKSYLVAKLEGTHLKARGKGERMPLGGTLSPSDIATIRKWISRGAKP
jgi:mono/diheme cytochrome c family protein